MRLILIRARHINSLRTLELQPLTSRTWTIRTIYDIFWLNICSHWRLRARVVELAFDSCQAPLAALDVGYRDRNKSSNAHCGWGRCGGQASFVGLEYLFSRNLPAEGTKIKNQELFHASRLDPSQNRSDVPWDMADTTDYDEDVKEKPDERLNIQVSHTFHGCVVPGERRHAVHLHSALTKQWVHGYSIILASRAMRTDVHPCFQIHGNGRRYVTRTARCYSLRLGRHLSCISWWTPTVRTWPLRADHTVSCMTDAVWIAATHRRRWRCKTLMWSTPSYFSPAVGFNRFGYIGPQFWTIEVRAPRK